MVDFKQEDTSVSDGLHGGDFPIRTKPIVLANGQNLTRGAVLGLVTADGKAVLSLSAATDGSQNVNCILAEDADASAGDVNTVAYISGDFNTNKMTFGADHTADSTKEAFRQLGIYIDGAIPA